MKTTISLSIIIKNESKIILKMLNNVYSLLDYYVVVDTGSSDGTQDIIKSFFEEKGIPGEIIQHKWKNFGDARNVALNATIGKVDYGFWIDPDDELIFSDDFDIESFKSKLSNYDGMYCPYFRGYDFQRISFFSTTMPWKWHGPLHELLQCDVNANVGTAEGLNVIQHRIGNSWSDKNKWKKYLKLMLDFMKNADKEHYLYGRWVFYLAQTYDENEDYPKAIEIYKQRSNMEDDGMTDERYISLYRIGLIKQRLNYDIEEIIKSFLECTIEGNPRIEHMVHIINYYNSIGKYEMAYVYSSYAMKFAGKYPTGDNVQQFYREPYDWEIYDLHNISCWWSGRIDEAKETFALLWKQVGKGLVTNSVELERITKNKQYNI